MGSRVGMSRWVLLCLQLLCLPGCSFWAVRGPDRSVVGGGDCSTSAVAPVIDGILAASFFGVGVAGATTESCTGNCWLDFSGVEQGAGWGLMAVGLIEAAAATYGAVKISECHEAKKHLGLPPISRPVPAPALRLGTQSASRTPP